MVEWGGYTYIGGGPLFIQQYSQAWLNLRDRKHSDFSPEDRLVPRVNFFENAVLATRAQREVGIDLSQRYHGYSANVWGITASESPKGYVAWGSSPNDSRIDGTVVPSAAAGSVMFAPNICIPALRAMLLQHGRKIYGPYGFADAFNPTTGWVSRYVIGIDVGITLLSAEDLRTGNVWRWFMSDPDVNRALDMIGFVPNSLAEARQNRSAAGEARKATSGLKTQGQFLGGEAGQNIPVDGKSRIPASAYHYKIPVPAKQ